jgi:hypothetical protein
VTSGAVRAIPAGAPGNSYRERDPIVSTESNTPSSDNERLREEAERLRASGVAGESGRLRELFDFLLAHAGTPGAVKEAEIAATLFGRSQSGRSNDDSIARVYMHRLRKRLEAHYASHPPAGGTRIEIPRGEYRMVLVRIADEPADASVAPVAPSARPGVRASVLALSMAFLALNAVGWAAWLWVDRPDPNPFRTSPVWSAHVGSPRPLTVVMGDYYMFGEFEDRLFLRRLIRDFSVNSKQDLIERYLSRPDGAETYGDVALQYLPASSASALGHILPAAAHARPRIVLSSELTPDILRSDDIIFVGLVSSLGLLREPIFGHSRFRFGESYDQIIDQKTGHMYQSEAFLAAPGDGMYRDYAYVASLTGPAGNHITIVSGARDAALSGIAESLTTPAFLITLGKTPDSKGDFEAIFEIRGQRQTSLETRLLALSPIDSRAVWDSPPGNAAPFPEE